MVVVCLLQHKRAFLVYVIKSFVNELFALCSKVKLDTVSHSGLPCSASFPCRVGDELGGFSSFNNLAIILALFAAS